MNRSSSGAAQQSLCGLLLLLACGTPAREPQSPASKAATKDAVTRAPSTDAASEDASKLSGLPKRCVIRKGACMPPMKWATKLCKDFYPDLALYMFRAGTPWTRFYMKTGLNAVNGWGPTLDEDLVTAEEVIVVNHRLRRDSVDVEGSLGTFDVLRWNGSCVTLDVNEVSPKLPEQPAHSKIDWRALSKTMQGALRENPGITETYRERRRECQGVFTGEVTARCVKLDRALMNAIARHVRSETELPEPEAVPK